MKPGLKTIIAAVIILSLLILGSAIWMSQPSGKGGYVVTPGNPSSTGVAKDVPRVSYSDLPLWIKAAAAIDGIMILICAGMAFPVIVSKLQNVLDNRNRLNIFNYVVENPGCTPSEITTRQNMKNGTVKYHIHMLESEGKIMLKKMGKFTRIFKRSSGNSELDTTVLSYLRNETSKSLLQAILENPGITNQKLSEKFELDKSSIHWHIDRFQKDSIVTFEQEGKFKRYFISPDARTVLIRHMPLNYQCPGMLRE